MLPSSFRKRGPVIGVGWCEDELKANPVLDDFFVQDLSVDPYLPLADNFFDAVIMPANFQLLQRPRAMFEEINRVLKPGGYAFVGVKVAQWAFLFWKTGRYYAETNYLEDVLALGSFFHYAEGFSAPESFDLTLPESNWVGQMKDKLFPSKRLDFFAVVQAQKKADSPHGRLQPAMVIKNEKRKMKSENEDEDKDSNDDEQDDDDLEDEETDEDYDDGEIKPNPVINPQYAPKKVSDVPSGEDRVGPFY